MIHRVPEDVKDPDAENELSAWRDGEQGLLGPVGSGPGSAARLYPVTDAGADGAEPASAPSVPKLSR